MRIQVYRENRLIGEFDDEAIVQGLESGRLRITDEYFFDGMDEKRSLEDFFNLASKKRARGPLVRIHQDKKRSRRESKRNDAILLSILALALIVGFGFVVYRDVAEKREQRQKAMRDRMFPPVTSPRYQTTNQGSNPTTIPPHPNFYREN